MANRNFLQEALSYLLTGGATTLINYVVYLVLLRSKCNYLIANTIAWAFAVTFAYVSNRIFVFRSDNQMGKELVSFVSLRFLTLILENLLLTLFIQYCNFHPFFSKIAVSVVTVTANYAICKWQIFRKPAKHPHSIEQQKGESVHE